MATGRNKPKSAAWRQFLPQAPKPGAAATENKSDQKALLDQSSGINRNLGLVMVSFLLYVLITVAGISDLQLLMDDKPIDLPILGVGLPVNVFAIVAPILVFGVHLNMLLNLLEHSRKLHTWMYGDEEDIVRNGYDRVQEQLHPFLFNYTAVRSNGSLALIIAKALVDVITYFLPLAVLLTLELRFSDYHSVNLTFEHLGILLLDAFLIFYFYPIIRRPKYYGSTFLGWIKGNYHRGFLAFSWIKLPLSLTPLKRWDQSHRGRWLNRFFRITGYQALFYGMLGYGVFYGYVVKTIASDTEYVKMRYLFSGSVFVQIPLSADSIHVSDILVYIPRFDVQGKSLARKTPSPEVIQQAIQNGWSEDSARQHYTEGILWEGRDFKFADFGNCNLIKGNLNYCSMQQTSFNKAILIKTRMHGSKLQNATFIESNLSEADLRSAFLDNSNLEGAKMHCTKLNSIKAHNSNFQSSEMHGAEIDSATLTSCDLSFANLSRASISNSNLKGVQFTFATLYACNFYESILSGVNFSNTILINSSFHYSKISGSIFFQTEVKECKMNNVTIDSSLLTNLELECCFPDSNHIYFEASKIPEISKRKSFIYSMLKHRDSNNFLKIPKSDTLGFQICRINAVCKEEYTWNSLLNYFADDAEYKTLIHTNRAIFIKLKHSCPEKLNNINRVDIEGYFLPPPQ